MSGLLLIDRRSVLVILIKWLMSGDCRRGNNLVLVKNIPKVIFGCFEVIKYFNTGSKYSSNIYFKKGILI